MSEHIPVQHRHSFIHKIFITISTKVKKNHGISEQHSKSV